MKFILILALLCVFQVIGYATAKDMASFAAASNDDKCDMCKYIVGEVEQYMNSSEKVIEEKLVQACKLLPGGLEQMCDTIVVLYGHQIIEYILEYETPAIVCKQVGLCSDKQEVQPEPQVDDTKCDLCVYVVGLVEDYLKGNDTEAHIKEALEKVCDKLGPMSGMCKAFVDEYEPYLIDLLTKKLPPKEVCQKLHLCPQQQKDVVIVQAASNEDGCALCKFIASTVEDYLKDNQTVTQIEEQIKKWCDFIPGDLGQQCKQYAEQYIPLIIDYIEQSYTPEQICQAIGVCPTKTLAPVPNDECTNCKFFMTMILNYIETNSTVEYIEEKLAGLCHYLPGSYAEQCVALEKEYLPSILHYLEEKYTAQEVCQLVGFCPAKVNPLYKPHHGHRRIKLN